MEEIQECFPQDFIQLFVNIEHGSWLNLVEHSEKIPSLEVSAEKYMLHKEEFYVAWAKLGWSTADDRQMCFQCLFLHGKQCLRFVLRFWWTSGLAGSAVELWNHLHTLTSPDPSYWETFLACNPWTFWSSIPTVSGNFWQQITQLQPKIYSSSLHLLILCLFPALLSFEVLHFHFCWSDFSSCPSVVVCC